MTCNLTLPIACSARAADIKSGKTSGPHFQYSKYNGWPEIKESLMAGQIQAAYMLAPLVMDLTTRKIPLKIVSLGHRSGAVIMVRTDSPYQNFKSLAGKRIAIPSRFAVDFLFLRRMLEFATFAWVSSTTHSRPVAQGRFRPPTVTDLDAATIRTTVHRVRAAGWMRFRASTTAGPSSRRWPKPT